MTETIKPVPESLGRILLKENGIRPCSGRSLSIDSNSPAETLERLSPEDQEAIKNGAKNIVDPYGNMVLIRKPL